MSDIANKSSIPLEQECSSAIVLDHVSMVFNMASERIQSLKEYFIKIIKHELMFKEFIAVNDISFTINKGDVFGLVGSNGSGKSTLLKIIAGVLEPSKGSCKVEGSIAPLIELGAGFDMELSARENIYLNGALLGYSKQFIEEHFDNIVEFAEIDDFLEMPMKNYSSGMVARIAFAIATETIPDILIVDEVLSVGDYMFQEKCEKRINALIENHDVTVLVVSHDNYLIERLCNKAAWIEKGNLKLIGDVETVCNAYRLLGWHIGSKENEEKLINLLCDPKTDDAELVETIAADDPCLTALAVFEEIADDYIAKQMILAPCDSPALCMLANSLSSRMNAPMLIVHSNAVSNAMLALFKRMKPDRITIVGNESNIAATIVQEIELVLPNVVFERIGGETVGEIALNAIEHKKIESSKVVVAYPECIGDLLLIMPYLYKHGAPILFNDPHEAPSQRLIETIKYSDFDEVVLLGGEDVFPHDVIKPILDIGIHVTRVCGDGAVDATRIIHDWIRKVDPEIFEDTNEICFASLWNMSDAYSVGRMAHKNNALVLLQDSKDVDNIMGNINLIRNLPKRPDKIVFFGDDEEFREVDKKVMATAI